MIFGYTKAQAVGRDIDELIVPEHLKEQRARGAAASVGWRDLLGAVAGQIDAGTGEAGRPCFRHRRRRDPSFLLTRVRLRDDALARRDG